MTLALLFKLLLISSHSLAQQSHLPLQRLILLYQSFLIFTLNCLFDKISTLELSNIIVSLTNLSLKLFDHAVQLADLLVLLVNNLVVLFNEFLYLSLINTFSLLESLFVVILLFLLFHTIFLTPLLQEASHLNQLLLNSTLLRY